MKFFLKLLPESFQTELFRRLVSTKKVYDFKDITIKLAETYEEYKKAFELLHDCYVKKGLMEKDPTGMRCNIHSFLPHNAIVIAINRLGEVVGTVSIIKDNPLGLPAESIYAPEVVKLRNNPISELVEISALSIAPEYRQHSHTLLFLLNKFLYLFSRDYFKSNMLIITIHPNASIFYKSLFNFKTIGKVFSYEYVKGALATLMFMDFSGDHEERLWKTVFRGRKDSLIDYILYQKDDRLVFPKVFEDDVELRNKEVTLRLIKASNFNLRSLSIMEISYLYSSLNLNEEDLNFLGIDKFRVVSDYRFQKKISARLKIGSVDFITQIYNISTNGAYVVIPLELLQESDVKGRITFKWKGQEFDSEFRVCWVNDKVSHKLPIGAGIEFLTNQVHFFNEEIQYTKTRGAA